MLSAAEIAAHQGPPLVMATAYDYPFARLLAAAGVDIILVGDSLANVVLGLPSTRDVGMEEMALFTAAAVRGAPQTHVTADMPAGSYDASQTAMSNARRFRSLGAASVKLEGPRFETVRTLVGAGIPVMGHIGVLPQTATTFRPVGKTPEDADRLLQEAKGLEAAGAFSLVLENVDAMVARAITAALKIPTIGIGAGPGTRGQVQVLHDLLGFTENPPPFAKPFAELGSETMRAMRDYAAAVRRGEFPP